MMRLRAHATRRCCSPLHPQQQHRTSSTSRVTPLSSPPGITPSTLSLLEGLLLHDRGSLARAITLVESSLPEHHRQSELLLDALLRHTDTRSVSRGSTDPPCSTAANQTQQRQQQPQQLMTAVHSGESGGFSSLSLDAKSAAGSSPMPNSYELDADEEGGDFALPPVPAGLALHTPPRTLRIGVAGPPGAGEYHLSSCGENTGHIC